MFDQSRWDTGRELFPGICMYLLYWQNIGCVCWCFKMSSTRKQYSRQELSRSSNYFSPIWIYWWGRTILLQGVSLVPTLFKNPPASFLFKWSHVPGSRSLRCFFSKTTRCGSPRCSLGGSHTSTQGDGLDGGHPNKKQHILQWRKLWKQQLFLPTKTKFGTFNSCVFVADAML